MQQAERTHLRTRRPAWSAPPGAREAVALAYNPEKDVAPRVVARGKGTIAEAIIAKAEEAGVAVVSDKVALEALRVVDVGQEIPPRVYHLVAEILAFVYNLGERPRRHP